MSFISLRSFAVNADVLVRNQRFGHDTLFFDLYLQATDTNSLYLSNSDFILNFSEANFTNPQLNYLSGSTELYNAYGNATNSYDSNFGTRIDSDGLNAYKLMIFVQLPVYSNQTDFLTKIARIDQQELTHKLGTFYITGATTLNANPQISWVTSGGGLLLKVNHRDSVTLAKSAAVINAVNPAIETEPAQQASSLAITATSSTSLSLSWTAGSGSGRILFIKEGSAISTLPVDGLTYTPNTEYAIGDQIGTTGAYSVFKGTGTSVTVTGLTANTTYHFALMEYEGDNGWSENYLQTNPDTLSETTDGLFITANVKVFLQGPYNTSTGLMNTALRMGNSFGTTNLLPSAQPYSGTPWSYTGTENVDTANHPSNAVDWVLVELRSTYNGSAVSGGRAAGFLLSDGSIMDTNGVDQIRFWNVNPGYYYVVIKHRNHLPVMSRDSISLGTTSSLYDFTNGGQGRAYGTDTTTFRLKPMSVMTTGIYGMRGGDGGGSVTYQVRYNGGGLNDRVAMLNFSGGAGLSSTPKNNIYSRLDLNLDRQSRYNGGGLNDRTRLLGYVGGAANSSTPLTIQIPNP
ncbi:MAG TPA: hypothetical protein DIW47_13660 [Bacteroidetes bacterium]|nr:hypothetical protein [Bacteroidota bacterium]